MARVILIEATPWDAAGAPVNVYLAGGGEGGYKHRGRTSWRGGVVSEPKFATAAGFAETGFTGAMIPQASKVAWFPADKDVLSGVLERQWKGADIEVLAGDDALAAPVWTTLLKGTVAEVKVTAGALELTVADLGKKLDDPFLKARFTGGGGIEGDAGIAERIKRRTFGKAFNIPGGSLLAAYNIFEFGDPAYPLNAFTAVRDKARVADPAPTVLAWQGSIAATLAALQASAPVGGSGVVAPSIACLKWWTQPSGPLTADIQGEVGVGYVNKIADIAERLAAASAAALAMTAGTVAAINAVRPDEAGVHIGDDGEATASVLDRLLLPCSVLWGVETAGTITLNPISFDDPVEAIQLQAAERVEQFRPTTSRKLAYQRAHRKHSDAEISVAVQSTDIEGLGDLADLDVVKLGPTGQVVESNGFTPVGDADALNDFVTMSAGGALGGAGGGQVTPAGIEAAQGVYIQNTLITIIAGLAGGIGTGNGTAIGNTLVSLSAGGGLAGAGGGQVTPVGLEGSSGVSIRNTLITIAAGLLNGIGTGTGTAVGNSLVSLSAGGALGGAGGGQVTPAGLESSSGDNIRNALISIASGLMNGIGTGAGTAVANNLISMGANGALTGGAGGQATLRGIGFLGDLGATTGGNLVINPGAEEGTTEGWAIDPTYNLGTLTVSSTAPNTGANSFLLTKALVADYLVCNGRAIPVKAGEVYWVRFRDRGGAATGSGLYNRILEKTSAPSGGFVTTANLDSTNALIAENVAVTTSYVLYEYLYTVPAGIKFISPSVWNYVNGPLLLYFDDIEFFKLPDLERAGSGHRLGDARNLIALLAASTRYIFTGTISYASAAGTPATATTSVTAGSLIIGDVTLSINAMSVGVTGTNGTTGQFQLYINNPTFVGGAHTLIATTSANDLVNANGRMWIGYCDVAFPSSGGSTGGGGGGGGGPGCPWVEAFVATEKGPMKAAQVVAGDWVLARDRSTGEWVWVEVESNEIKREQGWRITAANGFSHTCSVSTPIELRDGTMISVPEIDGHAQSCVEVGEGEIADHGWQACRAEPVGPIAVAHIRCGGNVFAAGDIAGHYIALHNPKP